MKSEFYAHSANGETVLSDRWQKLAPQIEGVARLAMQFAKHARLGVRGPAMAGRNRGRP